MNYLTVQIVLFVILSTCSAYNFKELNSDEISNVHISMSNRLKRTKNERLNVKKKHIRHKDIWTEENESVILNCSLKVNKDQHVVWHRKYEKLGVHVLTIESETFISDLRIRPIKETFQPEKSSNLVADSGLSNALDLYANKQDQPKFTWNLEIRRLKKEDSALYYCVLNSANSYGQIYKLNVLPHLRSLNGSELMIDDSKYDDEVPTKISLVCRYESTTEGSRNQIRWYFHHYRLNNNLKNFRIVETKDYARNITTSTLYINNFRHKEHVGKYRCQYKGLYKMIRVHAKRNRMAISSSNRLVNNGGTNKASFNLKISFNLAFMAASLSIFRFNL